MELLHQLQRRVPLVSDKLLVNLVNGVQISKGIIDYRQSRGFFGQLLDKLTGSDRKRQILLDGNLIAGQQALKDWVLELTDSLRISQVALQVTQESLLETRDAIRNYNRLFSEHLDDFIALSESLDQLALAVHGRFDDIETRVKRLEINNSARDDFDRIITKWRAKQTYNSLPWVFQVVFLARETFSSSVATYEIKSGDTKYFRDLLVSKIVAENNELPNTFFDLHQLYEQNCHQLNSLDIELVRGLIETNSIPRERLVDMPYHYSLSTSLELMNLPQSIKPPKPAECALELCRSQIGHIEHVTDTEDFIKNVVEEAANDSITILSRGSQL